MIYYLNLRHGDRIVPDIEGIDLPDMDAVRQEAIVAARELMAEAIRQGEDISDRVFEIADGSSGVLAQVPFVDAIRRSS